MRMRAKAMWMRGSLPGVPYAAWAFLSMLGACADQPAHQMHLVPAAHSQNTDIPLPEGFRIVDDASEDRATGTARLYLRHLYHGQADKYLVRNFYREQMPLARWSLVSQGNIRGHISMRFKKASEACEIEIRDIQQGFSRLTEVQVLISQEQKGTGPEDDRRASGNAP